MRRVCTEDELLEQWTLAPEERLLVLGKSGEHCLGFALLLKFLQNEGRFPRDAYELPAAAVVHVARQLQVRTDTWADYDWKGRTIKYHRAAIRDALGFRESTVADSEVIMSWAAEHVLPREMAVERVKAAVLGRYRQLRLEPAPQRPCGSPCSIRRCSVSRPALFRNHTATKFFVPLRSRRAAGTIGRR